MSGAANTRQCAAHFIRNRNRSGRNFREMNIAQPIVVRSFNVISQQANIKEIEMNTYKPISALTSVLMLSTALSGHSENAD
jgi:hypothetical protein